MAGLGDKDVTGMTKWHRLDRLFLPLCVEDPGRRQGSERRDVE